MKMHFLKMSWGFTVLFFFIHAPASFSADSPVSNVETLRDPLHPGSALYVIIDTQSSGSKNFLQSELQLTHTFEDDFLIGLNVPFVFTEKTPAFPNAKTPRLGGGSYDRITLFGQNRLLGNEVNYLNFTLLIGFPFQSDEALQNSPDQSWLIGGSITGHLSLKPFALELSLNDADSFPNQFTNANKIEFYNDSTNLVFGSAQLFYYANDLLDLRATYHETAPSSYEQEQSPPNAYILTKTDLARSRRFGLGLDYALNKKDCLLTFDASQETLGEKGVKNSILWSGSIKWIF